MDLANPYEMKSLCRSTGVLAQISFPLNTSRRVLHNFRLRDCPEWRLPIRVCACGGGKILKSFGGGPRAGAPHWGSKTPPPTRRTTMCQGKTGREPAGRKGKGQK